MTTSPLTQIPENLVLITNGVRPRSDHLKEMKSKIATLSKDHYESQEVLQDDWEQTIQGIDENDQVPGAGGIFTEKFANLAGKIALQGNIWCPTNGLGLVNLELMYPQYDLGDGKLENSIRSLIPSKKGSDRDWWDFLCNLGASFEEIILKAVGDDKRIIVAIPGLDMFPYRNDLARLAKESTLEAVRTHLRFVGPDLQKVLPARLLPCEMPFDRKAIDRLIPGPRTRLALRMAALYEHVCPSKTPSSNPVTDYRRLSNFMEDATQGAITNAFVENGSTPKTRLTDEEAEAMVKKTMKVAGELPDRVARMIKAEGYSIKEETVSRIMKSLSQSQGAAKPPKSAPASKAAKPAAKKKKARTA